MSKDQDEEREEYVRERTRETATNARPAVWALAFAASVAGAGGKNANATQIADQALAAFDHRFVNP